MQTTINVVVSNPVNLAVTVADEVARVVVAPGNAFAVTETTALQQTNLIPPPTLVQTKLDMGIKGEQGDPGAGLVLNATGVTADRSIYDSEVAPFSFLDTDTNLLYFRKTVVGEWSAGVLFSPGVDGTPGASAYETAVGLGFVGTEQEWLDSFAQGKSAYDLAVANGFVGTELAWLSSLIGAAGSSAYAIAVQQGYLGTASEWLLTLVGDKGDTGLSAFEVAVAAGFVGLQSEWLLSLTGPAGASAYAVAVAAGFVGDEAAWLASIVGADGASAYDVAVTAGFVGNEAAWLLTLKGLKGDIGLDGQGFVLDAYGIFADRALYNAELEGFSYLATDTNMLYFRETVTAGVWSVGIIFGKGDQGDQGPIGVGVPGADYAGAVIFTQNTEPLSAVDGDIWVQIP